MRDGGHEYAKEQVRHRREGEISIVLADETTSAKVALYSNTGREAVARFRRVSVTASNAFVPWNGKKWVRSNLQKCARSNPVRHLVRLFPARALLQ